MKLDTRSLFQFGSSALYFDSTGKAITCCVFIDTGWRDPIQGYDSHPGEIITILSIQLEDVPVPRIADQIKIDGSLYTVMSIQAQDDIIAVLHVTKL
jgi:hypothetical protein